MRRLWAATLVGVVGITACGPCPQIAEGYEVAVRDELARAGAGGVDLAHPSHLRIDIGETAFESLMAPVLPALTLSEERMRQELPGQAQTVLVTDTMATVVHAWPLLESPDYQVVLALDVSLRVRRDAPGADDDSVYFVLGEAEVWGRLAPDADDPRRVVLDLSEPRVTGLVLDEGLLPEEIARVVRPGIQAELVAAAASLPASTEVLWVPEVDLGYRSIATAVTEVGVREDSGGVVLHLSTGLREVTPLRTAPEPPGPEGIEVSWSPSLLAAGARDLMASGTLSRRYLQGDIDPEGPTAVTVDRAWSDDGAVWVRFDLWRSDSLECYHASMVASSDMTVVDGDVQQTPRLRDPTASVGEPPDDLADVWLEGDFLVALFGVAESLVDYDPLRLHREIRSDTSSLSINSRSVRVVRRLAQAGGSAP